MYFKFKNALLSLFTASHSLWLTQAHPGQRRELANDAVLVQNSGTTDGDVAAARWTRRADGAPPNWGQGQLGETWTGFVDEPANSGWTQQTAEDYAYYAWKATQESKKEPLIVAALWVPSVGVYLGTQPRGMLPPEKIISAQAGLDSRLKSEAPVLWRVVSGRTYTGNTKWHAEDTAMWVYEKEKKPQGSTYPARSYMYAHGQYSLVDKASHKSPCGEFENENARSRVSIKPSCYKTLGELGVDRAT